MADTHIPVRARTIPRRVFEIFRMADFVVHAGDLVELAVIDELERLAPVLAVRGNMDSADVRKKLPEMNSFKVFEWKIGVIHDLGALFGARKMRKIATQKGFSALVYGHTHRPSVKWENGILFINPGSPTSPIPPFMTKPSVALLRITRQRITPEIINL